MKTKYKNHKKEINYDRLYSVYHNMKSRCYLKTFSRYEYYGGRGIKICKEWLGKNGFNSFYNWAVNNGYKNNLSIDRIDNDKDYCPENCHWVTQLEQNNNTRKNHYYTYNGETKTIAQWARQYNVDRYLLNIRIRRGWDFLKAIETPKRDYGGYIVDKKNIQDS